MAPRRWSFLVPILLFTAAMTILLWTALFGLRVDFEPLHAIMLAWFTLVTASLHLWQEHAMATDPKGFMRRFMGSLALKMLLSLGLLTVLLLRAPKEKLLVSGVAFAVLYLAYLAFSTVRLSALARKLSRA